MGGYQDFEKDKSFTRAIYTNSDVEKNLDDVDEEELLDEYFLSG